MIYSSKSQLYPNNQYPTTNSRLRDNSSNSRVNPNLPLKVYIYINKIISNLIKVYFQYRTTYLLNCYLIKTMQNYQAHDC